MTDLKKEAIPSPAPKPAGTITLIMNNKPLVDNDGNLVFFTPDEKKTLNLTLTDDHLAHDLLSVIIKKEDGKFYDPPGKTYINYFYDKEYDGKIVPIDLGNGRKLELHHKWIEPKENSEEMPKYEVTVTHTPARDKRVAGWVNNLFGDRGAYSHKNIGHKL